MSHKVVGVIGGMGPDATIALMQRVIALTPAEDDSDHIHMLVDNNPKVPSRLKALLGPQSDSAEKPGPVIAEMAMRLEAAGADFIVMPCNTAHHYHHYAARVTGIPVWHLIELCAAAIKHKHPTFSKVGVLASSATHEINLFEPQFETHGLSPVYPDRLVQDVVMELIVAVKAGKVNEALISNYNASVAEFAQQDIDCLLLGCSELSTFFSRHTQRVPLIDSVEILAEAIVVAAG
ncbi:MAG: aspartate/glutamate racemase family protein [Pseudomonadales bacterium]